MKPHLPSDPSHPCGELGKTLIQQAKVRDLRERREATRRLREAICERMGRPLFERELERRR